MSETFTPGPWTVDEDWRCGVYSGQDNSLVGFDIVAGKVPVVGCEGIDGSEQGRANAHLIAAAPDLYEALVEARAELEGYHADQFGGELYNNVKLNAALAKAVGQS